MKRLLLASSLFLAIPAVAAPPAGIDENSPTAQWYRGLQQPGTNYSCCSLADCRPVQFRMKTDHYEAFIDKATFGSSAADRWEAVPNEAVIHTANPTGGAVACVVNGEIRCFVKGTET